MTKSEFIQRRNAAEKKLRRFLIAGIACMGLCLICAAALGSAAGEGGQPSAVLQLLSKILLGTGIVLFLLFLALGSTGDLSGLPCHKCGRKLTAIPAQIAVATCTCCHCGEAAFG